MHSSMLSSLLVVLAAASTVLAAPATSEKSLLPRDSIQRRASDPIWVRDQSSNVNNNNNSSSNDNSTSSDNNNNNSTSNNNNDNNSNNNNNDNNNDNSNNNNNDNNNDKNKGSKDNNNDSDVDITQVQETEESNGIEQVFEKKVDQLIIKNRGSNQQKIEKRTQEIVQQNGIGQTTVVQVVQTIIQVDKKSGSRNKRYAISSLIINQGQSNTMSCQLSDAQSLTVGECRNLTGAATAATASAASDTGNAQLAQATGSVNAPFSQSNQTQLLPSGAAFPQAAQGVMVMADPAADIQDDDPNVC